MTNFRIHRPAEVILARPASPSDGNHKFFAHLIKSSDNQFSGWYEAYVHLDETPVFINPNHIERVVMGEPYENPNFRSTAASYIPQKDPY